MLKYIQNETLVTQCIVCGEDNTTDLSEVIPAKFMSEFNEYENFYVDCDCGAREGFNLNIPVDDTDEPFSTETEDIPVQEEIQRYYVRLLQRMVREDFVNERKRKQSACK